MKRSIITSALVAAALLLSAGVSPAAESEHSKMGVPLAVDKAIAVGKSAKTKAAKVKIVDINSAGKAALKTLPGIGDAEAKKIIAGRPYLTKADLVTENILRREVYEDLKHLVIAKQNKATAAKLSEMQKRNQ